MNLTVTDADIEVLADQLNVVIDDAYKQGQQAERGRIKKMIEGLIDPTDPWIHFSVILEEIDDSKGR